MIRTQIQLGEQQIQALKILAARDGVSLAEIVRRAVELLVKAERLPSADEQRQRALKAAGRFASGCRDVAREHDGYLAEGFRN